MPETPTLSDGVVILRALVASDTQAMYEAVVESIPEVSPWLPWCHVGYTQAETSSFVELTNERWAQGTQFQFGIFDSEAKGFLGSISINHLARANRLANVGYWVRSTRAKRGVASRAVRLVAMYAFQELGLTRLEIACIPGNAPSRRVAEKSGAKLEAISRNRLVMHGQSYDAALYSLTPQDIAASQSIGRS